MASKTTSDNKLRRGTAYISNLQFVSTMCAVVNTYSWAVPEHDAHERHCSDGTQCWQCCYDDVGLHNAILQKLAAKVAVPTGWSIRRAQAHAHLHMRGCISICTHQESTQVTHCLEIWMHIVWKYEPLDWCGSLWMTPSQSTINMLRRHSLEFFMSSLALWPARRPSTWRISFQHAYNCYC